MKTTEEPNEQPDRPAHDGTSRRSVYLVMCRVDYEGSDVEAVFPDRRSAESLRDSLQSEKDQYEDYVVEEWVFGVPNSGRRICSTQPPTP